MGSPDAPIDLLELKMLPAWATEPARTNDYTNFAGEETLEREGHSAPSLRERQRRPRGSKMPRRDRPPREGKRPPPRHRRREEHSPQKARIDRPRRELPPIVIRFLPQDRALNNVIAQIKAGAVAYSVFALARLFLAQPQRYAVRLSAGGAIAAPPASEAATVSLYQLGDSGPVAADRHILESNAFAAMRDELFAVETAQSEPIKGNFSNVARDRASGTLLGPTNHHGYQPALRALYEQRYSRRMNFGEFQRQIEIVSDPAVVEQWKEQARNVTTFVTKDGDEPQRFQSAADAERFFRSHYLPSLVRTTQETTISGVLSRRLPDRALSRAIEQTWTNEMRSPSRMMQELATQLRAAGLTIFRHRRGMLYVTPVRPKPIEETALSESLRAIIEAVKATPQTNRKQLAEKLIGAGLGAEEMEKAKLALASDLRWLIREGHVIEFNDGSLDLPRVRQTAAATKEGAPAIAESNTGQMPPAQPDENAAQSPTTFSEGESEIPAERTI
jgi:hypothetical protein